MKTLKEHTSYTNRQIAYILIWSACYKLTVSYKHEINSRDDKSPYPASPESSPDFHTILLTKYLTNLLTYLLNNKQTNTMRKPLSIS